MEVDEQKRLNRVSEVTDRNAKKLTEKNTAVENIQAFLATHYTTLPCFNTHAHAHMRRRAASRQQTTVLFGVRAIPIAHEER
jgi:hypothetical protein